MTKEVFKPKIQPNTKLSISDESVSPNISSDELMTSWDLQPTKNAFANTIRYCLKEKIRYTDKILKNLTF